MLHVELVGFIW